MSTEPPAPTRGEPLDRLVNGVAECWDHATSVMERTLAGTYDADDARRDLAKCSAKAAEIGLAMFTGWLDMLRPPPRNVKRNPPSASVTVPIDASMAGKRLDVCTDGFRGIGWANQFLIPDRYVTVQRAVVHLGEPEALTVTVSFEHVSAPERERTIIYEGWVRDLGTPGLWSPTSFGWRSRLTSLRRSH